MSLDEYMLHPAIHEAAQGFLKVKLDFEEMREHTTKVRTHIDANRDADPAAAMRLLFLLDERLALLTNMIAAADRVFTIIASAGAVSPAPTQEMSHLLSKLTADQKVLKLLIDECMKIAPGSGAGSEAIIQ